MHICVHGEWRWQRWQIQDNRTRSRAEDTVQNGQRLMCVFTFAPLICPKLPQNCKAERLSLASGGAQVVPHGKSWGQAKPSIGFGVGQERVRVGQVCLQHPNTPKKLEIPQAHAQTVHLKTYSVYFCRFDQKAKTKPEGRHEWKKRTYLYFKQVLNLGSYTACFMTYQKPHCNQQTPQQLKFAGLQHHSLRL